MIRVGSRVMLPADDEGNPEERGTLLALADDVALVELDDEFRLAAGDDGLRECPVTILEELDDESR